MDKFSLSEAHPTEICKLLTNKTASEKAQIKSREIAKRDFKGEYTNTQYGVKVEIIGEVKEININGQSGIELFAKAWRGDKQLGFGKDGSVEVERFRIFNPPILVDDPNGDIVRQWTDKETGELKQRKLRESPQEAIRQSLTHTIKIVGKENNNITVGKVGNTTSTFYPNAGAVSPCDGYVFHRSGDNTWAFHHGAANGNTVSVTELEGDFFDLFIGNIRTGSAINGTWDYFIRSIVNFDTSSIPDTDNITSATFSFTARTKRNGGGVWGADVVDAVITGVSPATTDNIVNGDYDAFGSTLFCRVVFADVVTDSATYNDAPLNSSGLSYISKTGVTSLGFRAKADFDNVEPVAAGTSLSGDIVGTSADAAGTSKDPKLVVVHSAPTPTPTPTPTDTTAPSGSVSINIGDSYTNSTSVTLTLSATDSVGVVGYYVSTSSSTPTASASGWNLVTSTTSYTGSVSYSLASGDESKTVYVWYKDAAGNVSSTASDSIILDATAPIVTIASPTSSDTYTTTSSPLSLSGSASDSSSGVKEVTWSSDKGGSGTARGTTYWSVSSISLTSGDNKITVTAKDNGGNTSTDTITVTYNAGSAPTVTTGSATNVTSTSATVTGTVNANGLSTTAWFEYSTISGSYTNKSSTQTVTGLTAGTTYYYRIAAQNNSGTSYGSEMSFQYSTPGSAPTVTTESATDVTTTTATLNGTVNANGVSTTAWFEYGTLSGTYGNKTTTKSVGGSTDTKVNIGISGLTSGTTYYYRIVAQNSAGTSYGKEMSFYYSTETKAPTVETEAATNVTDTSATLNGKCNPNGLSTTVWFEYGTLSGTYEYQTSTQSMSGSSYTKVSAAITGLTAGTKYYYRIVAKNSVGTSYGTEMEFYKSPGTDTTPTPVATPTPTTSPAPTLPPLPTPQVSPSPINEGFLAQTQDVSLKEGEVKDLGTVTMEQAVSGKIYGYVVNIKGDPIEFARLKLKGIKTKVTENASTDADGFFEFTDLEADTYVIVARKKKYRNTQHKVVLEEGESTEIEIVMKKTSKRIKGLLLEEDVQ